MKRILFGMIALIAFAVNAGAADLSVKAPPANALYDWTGFYIGVQGGAGWGTSENSITAPLPLGGNPVSPVNTFGIDGLFAGGTAGFNWQTGPVVFGWEGDISGAKIDGDATCALSFSTNCHTNLNAFATVTGRLGLAADHALFYIKAGGAWARFDHSAVGAVVSLAGVPFGAIATASVSDKRTGLDIGVGIEYNFWKSWSAKIEYNYMDFGTKNLTFPFTGLLPPINNVFADDRERVHLVRAGLNWRFNWGGPVIAGY